jgi:hydrogenase expression/formation protein HypD
MRFVDEYRDPVAARALVARIGELAGSLGRADDDPLKFMEVCGGHTHTIYRHGIEHVLPETVELVHGSGCPVCVIPMGRVDDAIAVAETPGVLFTTFGDMMRVPGSQGSLLQAKATGADVRFVYSPLDALRVAVENPDRRVVFFGVGFETTAPSTALTLLQARARNVTNFSVL